MRSSTQGIRKLRTAQKNERLRLLHTQAINGTPGPDINPMGLLKFVLGRPYSIYTAHFCLHLEFASENEVLISKINFTKYIRRKCYISCRNHVYMSALACSYGNLEILVFVRKETQCTRGKFSTQDWNQQQTESTYDTRPEWNLAHCVMRLSAPSLLPSQV